MLSKEEILERILICQELLINDMNYVTHHMMSYKSEDILELMQRRENIRCYRAQIEAYATVINEKELTPQELWVLEEAKRKEKQNGSSDAL